MRILVRSLLVLVLLVVVSGVVIYADGASLPVDHTVSVSGSVAAPPDKVFALIADVGGAAAWRHQVKSVKVLPPDDGRDHWIEDLGHNTTMEFVATRTDPVTGNGTGRREVLLNDPGASYGGTWVYEIAPGASPRETRLRITESGFIHPPLYRFMMAHVFGPAHNLNQYMTDIQAAARTG